MLLNVHSKQLEGPQEKLLAGIVINDYVIDLLAYRMIFGLHGIEKYDVVHTGIH